MSCKYSDFQGCCQNFDPDSACQLGILGCDDKGNCVVEEDPDPSYSCDTYESLDDDDDFFEPEDDDD